MPIRFGQQGLAARYTTEIAQQLRYLATWLPQTVIAVGDIGTVRNGIFERVDTLEQRRIKFAALATPVEARIRYVSETGVSTQFKASGHAPAAGSLLRSEDAGCSIEFANGNTIFFEANNCTVTSIVDRRALYAEILSAFRAGCWPRTEFVVTEVLSADSATILIGGSAGGLVELSASAPMDTDGPLSAELGLRTVRSKGMATEIVATGGLTPLFRAGGIRRRLFGHEAGQLFAPDDDSASNFEKSEWIASELTSNEIAY